MTNLAVVATNPGRPPAAQAAHDLRNILACIGLHLETLQRLSGPSGAKAGDAAYGLLTRGTAMCNSALDCAVDADNDRRRRRVDLIETAREIADLLAPSAPKDFCFDIGQSNAACALADPNDVFRILFNLMSNAVSVASRKADPIKSVAIRVSIERATLTMQVRDDGPGLPAWVRSRLFRAQSKPSTPPRHGYGLAIARELAERNGGTLTLAPSAKGTTFELKLTALRPVLPQHAPRYFQVAALASAHS
jgi:signal transduction histidine kinase